MNGDDVGLDKDVGGDSNGAGHRFAATHKKTV